jgi:prepilin-type processing-associated H-X9-DG protein
MYCPKCGIENPDDVQLCHSCSWVLTSISTTAQNPNAKTSGLAITSLVLGILSIFTLFLTALPAIILGIIGIFKIEKSAGQLKGKGLAIAGIAAPAAIIPFALLMGILMPALSRVRMIAQRQVCTTNMASLGKAMLIYAYDSNDMYPTSSKWCDLLTEYADVTKESLVCKGASEGPCSYAMNKNIEKLGTKAPPDIVLLFETKPGWNQCGGPEILSTDNHRGEGCNVLFNDGHVEFVKIKDINNLKWMAE